MLGCNSRAISKSGYSDSASVWDPGLRWMGCHARVLGRMPSRMWSWAYLGVRASSVMATDCLASLRARVPGCAEQPEATNAPLVISKSLTHGLRGDRLVF